MDNNKWKKKIEFSYVGNIPGNHVFKNIKHILPCYGKKLSKIISSHHIYLTGSINEPGGIIILRERFVVYQFYIEIVALYQNIVRTLVFHLIVI